MPSDEFDMTLMKTRMTLVYLSFIGWVGIGFALMMPLVVISTADDLEKTPLLLPLWIGGGVLSIVMGIVLLLYQMKRQLSKVGIFFVIVGLSSLVGAAYIYLQNDSDTEQPGLLAPPTVQGSAGN
jgi:uncharacterized membrane protein